MVSSRADSIKSDNVRFQTNPCYNHIIKTTYLKVIGQHLLITDIAVSYISTDNQQEISVEECWSVGYLLKAVHHRADKNQFYLAAINTIIEIQLFMSV